MTTEKCKYTPKGEWMNKYCYLYNGLLLAIKKNGYMQHMDNSKSIMLCERSQKQKRLWNFDTFYI